MLRQVPLGLPGQPIPWTPGIPANPGLIPRLVDSKVAKEILLLPAQDQDKTQDPNFPPGNLPMDLIPLLFPPIDLQLGNSSTLMSSSLPPVPQEPGPLPSRSILWPVLSGSRPQSQWTRGYIRIRTDPKLLLCNPSPVEVGNLSPS